MLYITILKNSKSKLKKDVFLYVIIVCNTLEKLFYFK